MAFDRHVPNNPVAFEQTNKKYLLFAKKISTLYPANMSNVYNAISL